MTKQLKLVGGIPTPLKNMNSSVGMLIFPTEWKNKIVPNHQPDMVYLPTKQDSLVSVNVGLHGGW